LAIVPEAQEPLLTIAQLFGRVCGTNISLPTTFTTQRAR